MTNNELAAIVCGKDDWIPQTDVMRVPKTAINFYRIYKHDRFYHKISWCQYAENGPMIDLSYDIVVPVEKTVIEYEVLPHDYENLNKQGK